jgi:hypothetical protein
MKPDIHSTLKNYFNTEIATIKKSEIVKNHISKLNLNDLHPEQQILKLHAELESMEKDQEDSIPKEYILFSDSPEHLFRIFFTKIILQKQNDLPQIKEAIILKEKITGIQQLLNNKKEKLKRFTLKDLKSGKNNVIFYQLKQCPPTTTTQEYNLMREYQSETILKTVEAELHHLKNTFLVQAKHSFKTYLKQEIKNCKNINLKYLLALTYSKIPNQNYKAYIKNTDEAIFQLPLFQIKETLKNYQSKNKIKPLSCPQLFCHSFNKYYHWLLTLSPTLIPTPSKTSTDYSKTFEHTYKLAIQLTKQQINQLKQINSKNYIHTLEKKLSKLKDYSQLNQWPLLPLTEENKPALKAIYFNHLILNQNPKRSKSQLFLAIQTTLFVSHYTQKLNHLYKRHNIHQDFLSVTQIFDLLSATPPGSDISNQLFNAISNEINHLQKHDMPIISIKKEIKNTLINIYIQAADNLENLYSKNNISSNACHALFQKKYLNKLILHNKRHNIPINPMVNNLIELFDSETNLLFDLKKINHIDIEPLLQTNQNIPTSAPFSFNYAKSDTSILENLVIALNLHIHFLANDTSSKKFVKIITAPDLDLINQKIHLNCNTNEFKYIIKKIKPLFKSLTYANIGKSKIFLSKKNNLITEQNLNNSKTNNLQSKQIINNIIAKKGN